MRVAVVREAATSLEPAHHKSAGKHVIKCMGWSSGAV
jgi:hypothetical protein